MIRDWSEIQKENDVMKEQISQLSDENNKLKCRVNELVESDGMPEAVNLQTAAIISDLEDSVQIARDDYMCEWQQKERLLTQNKELLVELSLCKRQVKRYM